MNKKLLNILTLGWAMICAGGPSSQDSIKPTEVLAQNEQLSDAPKVVASLYDMGFRGNEILILRYRGDSVKSQIRDILNLYLLSKEILRNQEVFEEILEEATWRTAALPKDEFLNLLLDPDFKLQHAPTKPMRINGVPDGCCAYLLKEQPERELIVLTKVENQIVFLSLDESEEY